MSGYPRAMKRSWYHKEEERVLKAFRYASAYEAHGVSSEEIEDVLKSTPTGNPTTFFVVPIKKKIKRKVK